MPLGKVNAIFFENLWDKKLAKSKAIGLPLGQDVPHFEHIGLPFLSKIFGRRNACFLAKSKAIGLSFLSKIIGTRNAFGWQKVRL